MSIINFDCCQYLELANFLFQCNSFTTTVVLSRGVARKFLMVGHDLELIGIHA